MIYAIGILKNAIDLHQKEIDKVNAIEPEMNCDEIFAKEEIQERRNYIYKLQKAILKLSIND